MYNSINNRRNLLKSKLNKRERLFAGWVSYAHPSITETFAGAGFDFIAIDMEHSTISLEQAQRIIAAAQSEGSLCLPRPVSHSNDWTKPLLDSGADGMLYPMVQTKEEVHALIEINKYPYVGKRSFGVNRAQNYGFTFDEYVKNWNTTSSLILQIESITAVENINDLLSFPEVDGVMIGPYDMSGSLGVPGQTTHPLVLEASKKVILACEKYGKSCGSQIADVTEDAIKKHFDQGYTYCILGSDLFVLWKWAENMKKMIEIFM
jgi:2-keto-3-deoxy-L-rhamnonate aldolase RhmA